LVTSLIEHESIVTTHAKAKEAQRLADKLISLTKKDNLEQAKRDAGEDLFKLKETIPKLFKDLRSRYSKREGGFTRVLRLEPRFGDRAEQSILELVDGPKEMKLWLTARIVARLQLQDKPVDPLTQSNIDKLIQYRENGQQHFDELVERCKKEFYSDSKVLQELQETLPPPVENMRKPYTGYTLAKGFKMVPRPSPKTTDA